MKLYMADKFTLTTTVGELIEELKKHDPRAFVTTEGCDCIGNVVGVSMDDDGFVCINRDDSALKRPYGGEPYADGKYADRIGDANER